MPHLLEELTDNAGYTKTTTGLHVHVSRANMTGWHMAKIAAFVYDPENRDFMEFVAGREFDGGYAQALDPKYLAKYAGARVVEVKSWQKGNYSKAERNEYVADAFGYASGTRYGALSFQPSTGNQTIEFRMFAMATNNDVVQARIEFAFLAWHFAHQCGMKEMNEREFAKFICRPDNRADSIYLRKYLAHRAHVMHFDAPHKAKPRKEKVA